MSSSTDGVYFYFFYFGCLVFHEVLPYRPSSVIDTMLSCDKDLALLVG